MDSKIAVLTGASSGIGQSIAIELSKLKYLIILIGRNKRKLENLYHSLVKYGGNARIQILDLRNFDDIERFGNELSHDFSSINLLVNAAGLWHDDQSVLYGKKLYEISDKEIIDVVKVNFLGPLLLTKKIIPLMLGEMNSKIINISGTFSNFGRKWIHYFVAKRALENLTQGLAEELRENNIQVNCISPSDVATESYKKFFPNEDSKLALYPEDVSEMVRFLISNNAKNLSGQIIEIRSDRDF